MAKKMMIDTEEGLMTWCKSTGSTVRLQRRGAKIIFDYLSGHDKKLSTNPEGELYMNDEHGTEKTTLDDVVDLVCEWNYEALCDARERKENPNDFLDYCRICTLERTLEEHKFILDRVFKQTVYGRDVSTIAHKLALEMMKEMHLVPIYDIPIADEIGVFNKVSEKAEYQAEDSGKTEKFKEADMEPEGNREPETNMEHDKDNISEGDMQPGADIQPDKEWTEMTAGRITGGAEQKAETTLTEVQAQPEAKDGTKPLPVEDGNREYTIGAAQMVHFEPRNQSGGSEAERKTVTADVQTVVRGGSSPGSNRSLWQWVFRWWSYSL